MAKGKEKERSKSMLRTILGYILYILVIIGLTWMIVTFVGQRTRVSGQSMETTLQDGDNLIVDKISYRFHDPSRYDIIVFPYKYEENTFYIKRIIGLPGEIVQVKDGYTYINGKKLTSDIYGREVMDEPGIAEEPVKLGKDEYFVLGDNRNDSTDSRDPDVGVLKKSDLMGRAWLRIYPFNKFGLLRHK